MSAKYFIFNDIDTREYGVNVTGVTVYDSPARSYTQTAVPGKNGDIFIDNGNYNNIPITYHCNVNGRGTGFERRYNDFRSALVHSTGYCELRDSYNAGIYRKGVLNASISPQAIGANWCAGEFDVSFSCKPQRYAIDEKIDTDLVIVNQCIISSAGKKSTGTDDCATAMIPVEAGKHCSLLSTGSISAEVFYYNDNQSYLTSAAYSLTAGVLTQFDIPTGAAYIRIVWDYGDIPYPEFLQVTYNGDIICKLCDCGNIVENPHENDVYPVIKLTTDGTVSGTDSFTIGDYVFNINVSEFTGSINIDCEAMTVSDEDGYSVENCVGVQDPATGELTYDFPCFEAGGSYLIDTTNTNDTEKSPYFTINLSGTGVTV